MLMTTETDKVRPAKPMIRPQPAIARDEVPTAQGGSPTAISTRELSIFFGNHQVLKMVNLDVPAKSVTAIIGPSGCGKSTFLRALNRMHDLVPNSRVEGKIHLFGEDIYAPQLEPVQVRRRIGMVFQKSNPFPTMSIAENVTVGLRLNGLRKRTTLVERTEHALTMAALWDEV